jgi:hypothetical protein
MPRLKWINDEKLEKEVCNLLAIAKKAHKATEERFGKNVIDPFAAIFEMSGFGLDYNAWFKNEISRQAQKSLQNHVGNFHQNILGHCAEWVNKETGNVIDLTSANKKIIAEIKNKYNTISGGKLSDLYHSLDNLVSPKTSIYKGYTAYYVAIIPKKPERYDKPFTPSDKEKGEKCPSNENIREIDGASFYHLVTGHENALKELYEVLPLVIKDCSNEKFEIKDTDKLMKFFNSAFG